VRQLALFKVRSLSPAACGRIIVRDRTTDRPQAAGLNGDQVAQRREPGLPREKVRASIHKLMEVARGVHDYKILLTIFSRIGTRVRTARCLHVI
jgi:hypothetical protein